ncbi:olfactory receptor 6F1-like [Pelodytes ibericus]
MQEKNQTTVTEFLLLGFQNLQNVKIFMFSLFLVFYFMTLSGNVLLIWLISTSQTLQSPMYFFLTQLSICDIFLTTNIVPNTLFIVLGEGQTMSFAGCLAQFYFFGGSESLECLLLSVMAYDRYLAICYPLHYISLMNHINCIKLASTAWLLSFSVILIDTISICRLHFCGPNVIDHFFCDLAPLLELSCSDTSMVKLEALVLCIPVIILPLIIIISSYTCIVLSIMRISSNNRRVKAFSTCSSHLTVVSMFYGTLIGIYVLPSSRQSLTISKTLSLLYTVVTPILNPIIYSLRNKDIKDTLKVKINEIVFQQHITKYSFSTYKEKVVPKTGTSAVLLLLPHTYRIHPVFHNSLVKPYQWETQNQKDTVPPTPAMVDGEEEYEVQTILDSRIRRSGLEYLVLHLMLQWGGVDMLLGPVPSNSGICLASYHLRPHSLCPHTRGRW